MDLTQLESHDPDGALRVVVESPRGARLKLAFDPDLEAFEVTRELPMGLAYPFDWGFVPGTLGEDGDPVDAMVLHHESTYPGAVLPCRVLGMVAVKQKEKGKPMLVNNRIIATPRWHEALSTLEEARDLPAPVREQLERFFVAVVALTGKHVTIKGWRSAKEARAFIRKARVAR